MIKLTRLNGHEFVMNAELIKFIEATPDTMITLRDGNEKVVVLEPVDEVIRRAVAFSRSLRLVPKTDQ